MKDEMVLRIMKMGEEYGEQIWLLVSETKKVYDEICPKTSRNELGFCFFCV